MNAYLLGILLVASGLLLVVIGVSTMVWGVIADNMKQHKIG